MKVIIKISIRIFLVFTVFQFINSFSLSVTNFLSWNQFNRPLMAEIGVFEILKVYMPFIVLWVIYIIIIVLLWLKSEKIAEKIIGESKIENLSFTLTFQSVLSIGIILIGIYLIVSSIPGLFSYLSNWTVNKTRFIDRDFVRDFTIRQIIEIIGIMIKLVIAFLIIKYNAKIAGKIMENNCNGKTVA